MANQRALFNPLEIIDGDRHVKIVQRDQVVEVSIDQLPDVILALQGAVDDDKATRARKAIQEMRDDLVGKKPASVHPIPNGNGPEAA